MEIRVFIGSRTGNLNSSWTKRVKKDHVHVNNWIDIGFDRKSSIRKGLKEFIMKVVHSGKWEILLDSMHSKN